MPELPEVETVKSGLEKAWVGKTVSKVILRRENLRYPFPKNFSEQMKGQKITAVRRRAKYLLIDTDGDLVFLSHLGKASLLVVELKLPKQNAFLHRPKLAQDLVVFLPNALDL